MKKTKFSVVDHTVLGSRLKMSNDFYTTMLVKLSDSFPKNSKQVNAVRKIIKNLTELRNVMDDKLGEDYPSEFTVRCYYGKGEEK